MKKRTLFFFFAALLSFEFIDAQVIIDEDFVYPDCTHFSSGCAGNWCNSHGNPDIEPDSCEPGENSANMYFQSDGTEHKSQGVVYNFGDPLEYGAYRISFCYCTKFPGNATGDAGLKVLLRQASWNCNPDVNLLETIPNLLPVNEQLILDDYWDNAEGGNCHGSGWKTFEKEFKVTENYGYLWFYSYVTDYSPIGALCVGDVFLERVNEPCDAVITLEDCLAEHCLYGLDASASVPGYCAEIVSTKWEAFFNFSPIPVDEAATSILVDHGMNGVYTYCLHIEDSFGCTDTECLNFLIDCFEEPPTCDTPENLGCERFAGKRKFSWDAVPGATSYQVEISINDICCPGGVEDFPYFNVTTNFYLLESALHNECLSWRVRAICDNGLISDWSPKLCYNNGECFNPPSHNGAYQGMIGKPGQNIPVIYPNPTTGTLNIEYTPTGELELGVEVYDNTGKLILSKDRQQFADGFYQEQLSLGKNASPGFYLVVLKTNRGTFKEKIILQAVSE